MMATLPVAQLPDLRVAAQDEYPELSDKPDMARHYRSMVMMTGTIVIAFIITAVMPLRPYSFLGAVLMDMCVVLCALVRNY